MTNGYELETLTNNCVLSTTGTSCPIGCTLCDPAISNGECLDEIIPKVEENKKIVNNCFTMEDYFSNIEFCRTQDLVIFHSETLKSDFENHVFVTSFVGLSAEHLVPLYSVLAELTSEQIKQYIQVSFMPEKVNDHILSLDHEFNIEERILRTELTISEDFESVELLIMPKFFNFIQELPSTALISSSRIL